MKSPPECEICGHHGWKVVYAGPIRDGDASDTIEGEVYECQDCRVQRLADGCISADDYQTGRYLEKYPTADKSIQLRREADFIPYHLLKDQCVLDIGAGSGQTILSLKEIAQPCLAVEPNIDQRQRLSAAGITTFPDLIALNADARYRGQVDNAYCFAVIEHVADPLGFCRQIKRALRPNGSLLLSTPNTEDYMLELLPDVYPAFFYRTAHQWYFNETSLNRVLTMAGLYLVNTFPIQRFGLNNLLGWMAWHKPPKGHKLIDGDLVERLEWEWVTFLERAKRSDYLLLLVRNIDPYGLH